MSSSQSMQDRWGECLDQGFLVVPITLLKAQKGLGVDNSEFLVLLHLLSMWHRGSKAMRSVSELMARTDLGARSIQRVLRGLEDKGLIVSVKEGGDKFVDLTPLVAKLKGLASS